MTLTMEVWSRLSLASMLLSISVGSHYTKYLGVFVSHTHTHTQLLKRHKKVIHGYETQQTTLQRNYLGVFGSHQNPTHTQLLKQQTSFSWL